MVVGGRGGVGGRGDHEVGGVVPGEHGGWMGRLRTHQKVIHMLMYMSEYNYVTQCMVNIGYTHNYILMGELNIPMTSTERLALCIGPVGKHVIGKYFPAASYIHTHVFAMHGYIYSCPYTGTLIHYLRKLL